MKKEKQVNSPRPTVKKTHNKIIFPVILIVVIVLLMEGLSVLVYSAVSDKSYSRKRIQREIKELAKREGNVQTLKNPNQAGDYMGIHVLHPYLGFVKDPNRKIINKYGLIGPDPLVKRSESRTNICITGGSVANHFFLKGKEALIAELKKSPIYAGKEINVICLALEGYKQPQQLISLNFFQFLGAEYDLVINLDGWNDLFLPFTENVPSKVFPFYPRMWNLYTNKSLDVESSLALAKLNMVQEERIKRSVTFSNPILNLSNFTLALWASLDQRSENQIQEGYGKLSESNKQTAEKNFQASGPFEPYKDLKEMYESIATTWQNASMVMNQSVEGMGGKYYHFLQPCQMYPNSKIFAKVESDRTAKWESGQGAIRKKYVIGGYEYLRRSADILKSNNVNFTDFTMIFEKIADPIYVEDGIHQNELGNKIMAQRIAEIILAD